MSARAVDPRVTAAVSVLARRFPVAAIDERLILLVLGLSVAPVLAVNGGYFPTSWGWAGVSLAWIGTIAALFRAPRRFAPTELVFCGGLLAVALWGVCSMMWTKAPTQGPLEIERTLAYVAMAFALVTSGSRRRVSTLLVGVSASVTVVCLYALATRLFPGRIISFDSVAGYRLSTPIGYWNGLGLVAAMGVVLALAFAAHAHTRSGRAVGAALVPLLATTAFFTFSRGAWASLFVALVAMFVVERRRLRFLATAIPVGAAAGVAVWLAARKHGLTHEAAAVQAAAHDGHQLAWTLLVLALVAAASAVAVASLEPRVRVPASVARGARIGLALFAIAMLVAVLLRFGSPATIARHAYKSFTAPSTVTGGDLNKRLLSFSGSGRDAQWRLALRAFEERPVTGIGPGGYEQYWLQHRNVSGKVRDAHSLYLEELAEGGIVGFALLLTALLAPFAALRLARREPLAAGAVAAYVAYLVHASVDWDWELSGITLAALVCGGAVILAGRGKTETRAFRTLPVVTGIVLASAALLGLAANLALAQSAKSARVGDWSRAAGAARRAERWAPWSAEPWQRLGSAQLALGENRAAQASLRTAIAKSPADWSLWLDLARASTGDTRRQALVRASELNPLSREIAAFRTDLGGSGIDITAGGSG